MNLVLKIIFFIKFKYFNDGKVIFESTNSDEKSKTKVIFAQNCNEMTTEITTTPICDDRLKLGR